MSTSLRQRLGELASSFAASVLDVIRGASLEDLLAESSRVRGQGRGRAASPRAPAVGGSRSAPRRGGRLPRRSPGDIEEVVEQIVALLGQSPKGLRAEQIRAKLDLQAKELPRPLKEALESGRLAKAGQKRATTYFLKGQGPSGRSSGRAKVGTSGSAVDAAGHSRRAPASRRGRGARKRGRPLKRADKAAAVAAPPASSVTPEAGAPQS